MNRLEGMKARTIQSSRRLMLGGSLSSIDAGSIDAGRIDVKEAGGSDDSAGAGPPSSGPAGASDEATGAGAAARRHSTKAQSAIRTARATYPMLQSRVCVIQLSPRTWSRDSIRVG